MNTAYASRPSGSGWLNSSPPVLVSTAFRFSILTLRQLPRPTPHAIPYRTGTGTGANAPARRRKRDRGSSGWLKRPLPAGNGNNFTAPHRRLAARNGVRKCEVPEPPGVLVAPHRDVHDYGQPLHANVQLLLGAEGRTGNARRRRTAAARRSRRPLGLKHVVDHVRNARRPAGWRRGSLREVHRGGSRTAAQARRSKCSRRTSSATIPPLTR